MHCYYSFCFFIVFCVCLLESVSLAKLGLKGITSPEISFSVQKSRKMNASKPILQVRAGKTVEVKIEEKIVRRNFRRNFLGLWGVLQVVAIICNAIKRLAPIAIQPLMRNDLSPFQWGLFCSWTLYMVYAEGYKAFQLKFSPMVVARSFNLVNNASAINLLFAGPFSMGLFAAEKKRMIIGWSVTIGVFALVKLVKLLPYPYRSIVDAGVVAGLSYGTLSICYNTILALLGHEKKEL